jgi:prepilin-type processing-associated H-X9-DG protein
MSFLQRNARFLIALGGFAFCGVALFFVFSSITQKRHSATCMDNLRKLSSNIGSYREDFKKFPDLILWTERITKNIPACPAAKFNPETKGNMPGYAYNTQLMIMQKPTGSTKYPATTIVVSEQFPGFMTGSSCAPINRPGFESAEKPCSRHDGGANFIFADGHVRWLKPEQVESFTSEFDTTNGNRPTFIVAWE